MHEPGMTPGFAIHAYSGEQTPLSPTAKAILSRHHDAFMKVQMKWGRWMVCAVIAVGAGFYRHWDTLSLVILSVVLLTGAIRLWVAVSAPGFEQRVAKMPPEKRELFIANLPEAERERWRERLRQIDAQVDV